MTISPTPAPPQRRQTAAHLAGAPAPDYHLVVDKVTKSFGDAQVHRERLAALLREKLAAGAPIL